MNIKIGNIELSKTNPWFRRINIDSTAFEELIESIREQGIQEPLLIRPIGLNHVKPPDGRYELIDGYRRLSAAKEVKLKEVPCHIREMTDEGVIEYQMIMFLHRQNLKPLEEAEGYKRMEDGYVLREGGLELIGKAE